VQKNEVGGSVRGQKRYMGKGDWGTYGDPPGNLSLGAQKSRQAVDKERVRQARLNALNKRASSGKNGK
jgi:hypothetical protein